MASDLDGAPEPVREPTSRGDSTASINEAITAFRARSLATNRQRIATIADALEAMCEGILSEDRRTVARDAAHSLAGSAGTFGFAEASQLGRSLEALLDDAVDHEDRQFLAQRGLAQVAQLRQALTDPPDRGASVSRVHGTGDGRP